MERDSEKESMLKSTGRIEETEYDAIDLDSDLDD